MEINDSHDKNAVITLEIPKSFDINLLDAHPPT